MASAVEQLASNLSWDNFSRAKVLQQRIFYTIILLLVFRLGAMIPVPGIDVAATQDFFSKYGAGFGDMINMFTGGALQQASILSLGIMPYISASIIMQLLSATMPSLEQLKKEGQRGRQRINQYTRYLTVILATIQGIGWATVLESGGMAEVGGWVFRATAVLTWVGGTMFLMWLGEQITQRGIGNGVSLIIYVGILTRLPVGVAFFFSNSKEEGTGFLPMILILLLLIGLILLVVFVERAMRKVLIQYQKRQIGNKIVGGDKSHLPIKVNPSGVIPAIFASSVLTMPLSLAQNAVSVGNTGTLGTIMAYVGYGRPLYFVLFAALVVFFGYFYTLNVSFKPDDVADNLKKSGAYVAGYRPGSQTADLLETILVRLMVTGSIYLVIVTVLPSLISSAYSLPMVLQGTSLLIVVSVTMDTVSQIQSHLMAYQYETLFERSRLPGKDRAKARKRKKVRKPRQ